MSLPLRNLSGVLLLTASLLAASPAGADPAPTVSSQQDADAAHAVNARAATDRIRLQRWSTTRALRTGGSQGVAVKGGSVRIATPRGTQVVKDPYSSKKAKRYDYGRWMSPWVSTKMAATNLIPSWNARTPRGTMVRIELRTRSGAKMSSWDTVATWSHTVGRMHRHSGATQADDLNQLFTDTLVSKGSNRINAWQVKVVLLRPAGKPQTPVLDSVGAVAAIFTSRTPATSKTTMTRKRELAIPGFSQMTHDGHYPQWGGGGTVWCSPTSMSMVLRFLGMGPTPRAYKWTGEKDGQVDFAARYTYDHAYEGTGNWPFNTAYAGHFGADAFVTRLQNLRDAEQFIRAGLPVVASIQFAKGGLDGSPLTSTNGHLVVISGFTKTGRVIVKDPAAPNNSTVRRVYRRDQFEKAWLGGSGGVSYVVRPAGTALPADTPRW